MPEQARDETEPGRTSAASRPHSEPTPPASVARPSRPAGRPPGPAAVLALQRAIGNRGTTQVLAGTGSSWPGPFNVTARADATSRRDPSDGVPGVDDIGQIAMSWIARPGER